MKKRLKKKLRKKELMKLVDGLRSGEGIVVTDNCYIGFTFAVTEFIPTHFKTLDLFIKARWKTAVVVDPNTRQELWRKER